MLHGPQGHRFASYEEMKARSVAIARGLHKLAPDDPKVWFTSAEAFALGVV